MRIPTAVVGRTRPSSQGLALLSAAGATPDAFGAGIGRGLEAVGASLELRARKLEEERAKGDQFEAKKIYAQESLAANEDFVRRQQEAPLGAQDFTSSLMQDYERRHQEVLAGMRERGFREEVIQDAELNFYGMRQSLQGKGLTFEQNSYSAKVVGDVEDMGMGLSQLASMNPQEMEDSIVLMEETIDQIPNLDAIAKDQLKRSQRETIALAAGFGLAQQNPGEVIAALGGQTGDYFDKIRAAESSGDDSAKNERSTATGRYQFTSGTWKDLAAANPEAGLTPDGRLSPEQQEIAIRLFTEGNRRVLESAGIEANHANLYAAHFLGAQGARDVLTSSNSADLAPIVGAKVMQANPHLRGMTVDDFRVWTARKTADKGLSMPRDGKTGNPVLDALSPAQRSQVLNQAKSHLSQEQTQFRAGFEQNVENASAALLSTGGYGGVMPSEADFYRAYEPIKAQQEWAKFQGTQQVGGFISDMRMMNPNDITAALSTMQPRDTSSPTYAADLQTYEMAQKAANNVMEQRAADPAGYVMRNYPVVQDAWQANNMQLAFRTMEAAYDELGIPPSSRDPFPKAQLRSMQEQYAAQSPEGKLGWLQSMRTQAGSMFPNALSQLADSGMKVEAYLSGLMAQSPAHEAVAANVLRGMEIIKNDPSRVPSAALAESEFRAALGDAQLFLDPRAAGAMLESAKALYAFGGGDPKNITRTDFKEVVRQIAGGLPGNSETGIMDPSYGGYFGAKVPPTILPPGVTGDQFQGWAESLTEDDLVSLGGEMPQYRTGEMATASDIADEGAFVRVGPDTYIVMMTSDGQPLLNSRGQRFTMRITPDALR